MPKRLGNLRNIIEQSETITQAFCTGIKNKKSHPSVREFWKDDLKRVWKKGKPLPADYLDWDKITPWLEEIREDLVLETYRHKAPRHKRQYCTSKAKGSKGGKWRDIYPPILRDHVVQHALFIASEPAFTRGMHKHCVGNVPGRGPKAVVRYVTKWCKTDMSWKYFVKLDIRKFFDSIRKEDIQKALARKIKDPYILALHDQVLSSGPIPCPVGYFLSPWYGNLILEPLDHYISQGFYKVRRGKRVNLVSHYMRYADDMLIMASSKRDLKTVVKGIIKWLKDNLDLDIKPNWEIKRIAEYTKDGKIVKGTYQIDYVGFRFDRTRTILRDSSYLSVTRLAHKMRKKSKDPKSSVTLQDAQSLVAKFGIAQQADAGTLHKIVCKQFPLTKCKEMISDDAKRRVCGEAEPVRDVETGSGSAGRTA